MIDNYENFETGNDPDHPYGGYMGIYIAGQETTRQENKYNYSTNSVDSTINTKAGALSFYQYTSGEFK